MYNIDVIVEKYLTGFKKYGHIVDVYENPTKKELREIGDKTRFIADAKNKKVYVWSAMGAVHGDTWTKIKKETNDPRSLYKAGDLLTGVWEGNFARMYAADYMAPAVRKKVKENDWSFVSKWYDITDLVEKL